MNIDELTAIVEAILFASDEPVSIEKLESVLQVSREQLENIFCILADACKSENRGIELIRKGNKFQFVTKHSLGQAVAQYLSTRKANLSNAAMEALAIAAYNQPVTKTYISQIRGITSSEIVETLVEKGLLAENGKMDLQGKPMGYVTTDKFLTVFNLESLDALPEAGVLSDELTDIVEEI